MASAAENVDVATARLARHNVRSTGQGTRTIMFAHGFGCDQEMWRFVAPAFERDWRIVLFDHAGAGPTAAAAYDASRHATLRGYADDVVAVAEALDLHDAVLVGHSVSATIAMLAAIAAPTRFSRLVLIGATPCYRNDPPRYLGGFEREQLDGLLALMAENYTAWADALAPTMVGGTDADDAAGETARARAAELRDSICLMAPDVALAFARATFLEDHRSAVPHVPVPSLILQCTADAIVPATVGAWLAEKLPQSTFHQLAATGHCPHMTHPGETIAAMQTYLEGFLTEPAVVQHTDDEARRSATATHTHAAHPHAATALTTPDAALASVGIDEHGPCARLSVVDGVIVRVNAAAERLLGRPSDALVGQSFGGCLTQVSVLLWESQFLPLLMVRGALDGVFLGASLPGGEEVPMLVAASRQSDEGHVCVEFAMLVARQRVAYEQALEAARDAAETARLEVVAAQAERREAIAVLAGGIAHNFNNLLAVVSGHAEAAMAQVTALPQAVGSGVLSDLEQLQRAVGRAAGVVRQLLAFSRQQVLVPGSLDVGDVVRSAESLLRPILETRTAWSVVADPRVGQVVADRGQLEQVLLNLVLNARDAIAESGRPGAVTIRVAPWRDEVEPSDGRHDTHGGKTPHVWTRVTVTDTGQGMSADTLAHACDPFFTTKGVGKGSGLGLAMVHGIVRQSGGRVGIESTPGSGTTVTIDLPVVPLPEAQHVAGHDDEATDRPAEHQGTLSDTIMADTACEATPTRAPVAWSAQSGGVELRDMDKDYARAPTTTATSAADPDESSECLLLVEDDPALRRLAARMLEHAGFTVLTCEDGDAAWRAWEVHRPYIRGVVSDVRMPGRDGHALRRALRTQSPALPIVLMSGYAEQPVYDVGIMDMFLEKPCTSTQLLQALAAIGLHPVTRNSE